MRLGNLLRLFKNDNHLACALFLKLISIYSQVPVLLHDILAVCLQGYIVASVSEDSKPTAWNWQWPSVSVLSFSVSTIVFIWMDDHDKQFSS